MSSSRSMAVLGLVLTSLFWAGNIFISKLLLGVVPPFTLNLLRWLVALLVLLPFVYQGLPQAWPKVKKSWLKLSIYGFLGVTIYNAFLYTAAYSTDSINIAVISTITPLLTFVFAWWFFGQKPHRYQVIGFVFGILGVLVLLSKGSLVNLQQLAFSYGDLWMLTACAAWAIYTAYLIKKPQGLGPLMFMFVTTAIGVCMAIPTVAWEWWQSDVQFQLSQTVVLSLLYVGIFPSVCSYLLFNHGVSILGSQTASLCAYLIPVFTAIIGILFLQETVYWFHIVSQLFVFIGFYLTLRRSAELDIAGHK